ncbi:hypothetical protein WR25_12091 [Diploscapter pachys]|uniref:Uncharacterized protein n=1 Tax=Diploscapter pachys TaxID=2018661 RepID=A0A2A2JCX0_9BILA|nr:hypothetical protein WR25_12091 [Diploscapter pachys]
MLTIRYGFTKRLSNFHKINKFHIHSVHYKSNNNPFYNQHEHKHKHFNFDNNFFFNHDDNDIDYRYDNLFSNSDLKMRAFQLIISLRLKRFVQA